MGKRASNYTSDFVNFEGKWLNTKKLVTEALEGIYSLFGLDFREDGDLIAGLKMHIHGLIDRVKAKAHMQDVFVEEIKRKDYPLVFDMGIYVVEQLEEKHGSPLSEVESWLHCPSPGGCQRAHQQCGKVQDHHDHPTQPVIF